MEVFCVVNKDVVYMSLPGNRLLPEIEELVVKLKKHHDDERKSGKFVSTKDPSGRTAAALGIGVTTVKRIMARYKQNGEKVITRTSQSPGRPLSNNAKNAQPLVRKFIRSCNLEGKYVSIEGVRKFLEVEHGIVVPKKTLWRSLNRWGFTHGEGRKRSGLKEQEHVILARRKYLREKRANRNFDGSLKRPEVYLDETYINKNYSKGSTWYLEEDGPWVNKPSGVGPRLIIVHAITKDGWVDNAQLVFEAKKKSGDYHGQMNWENFSKWFTTQLLENIPSSSIIILDNAKYHNVFDNESFPNKNCTKEQLRSWLTQNNYPWRDDLLKSELLDLCNRFAPQPQFRLDQLAGKRDFKILRTPPYHPELQPIETCWAIVKDYMAKHCDFTMAGLFNKLPKAFAKVTAYTCENIINEVVKEECRYSMS